MASFLLLIGTVSCLCIYAHIRAWYLNHYLPASQSQEDDDDTETRWDEDDYLIEYLAQDPNMDGLMDGQL